MAAVLLALAFSWVGAPPTAHAAAFVVNSTVDASDAAPGNGVCATATGLCTLRAAIQEANAFPGLDTITFNIAPGGVQTITPASVFVSLTSPVIIDGTTQPGFAGTPIIELNGSLAGATATGLKFTGGSSTLRGLVINRYGAYGVRLDGGGANIVEGNFIGTNVSGTAALGNVSEGVYIVGSSANRVGGTALAARNVISGNGIGGVRIVGPSATGNKIHGNYIGTAVDGVTPLGNGGHGVSIASAYGNAIGGAGAGEGNTIAYNTGAGVQIWTGATSNAVLSNSIHSNGLLGIDLALFDISGVTPNDPGDPDTGPNNLQNFPVLSSATSASIPPPQAKELPTVAFGHHRGHHRPGDPEQHAQHAIYHPVLLQRGL